MTDVGGTLNEVLLDQEIEGGGLYATSAPILSTPRRGYSPRVFWCLAAFCTVALAGQLVFLLAGKKEFALSLPGLLLTATFLLGGATAVAEARDLAKRANRIDVRPLIGFSYQESGEDLLDRYLESMIQLEESPKRRASARPESEPPPRPLAKN